MATQKKVLLVEDDETTQFMMVEFLNLLGAPVEVAANGDACLSRLNAAPETFSVILMDIHMPGVSGVEATATIRDAETDPPRGLPIIAVTADEAFHDSQVVSSHGMDGFLRKPVDAEELSSLVNKYARPA